jgi:protein-disulfide isomerase
VQPKRPRKRRAVARRGRLPWRRVAFVGVAAVVVVLGVILFGNALRDGDGSSSGAVVTPGARGARQEGCALGEPDAPVTIMAYFSFYCGHCGDFARETAPLIEKAFVEPGLLRFELHPLATEGNPLWAAEGCACASDQDRYWDYHDLLFANQYRGAYEIDKLKGYAAELGLDTEAFNACLDSHKYQAAVVDETIEVAQAGITSTPTFFIGSTEEMASDSVPYSDHTKIVGAYPYDTFKQAIEEELEKVQ